MLCETDDHPLAIDLVPGVQGKTLSSHPTLAELYEMCRRIQTLGRMLPEPDKDLMLRVSQTVQLATEIHKDRSPGFSVQDSCLMLQSLGNLVAHEELAPFVVTKCKNIIPSLLVSFARHIDLLEKAAVVDTFYWFGYLGPTYRTISESCRGQFDLVLSHLSEIIDVLTPVDVGKVSHALAFLKIRDAGLLLSVDNHSVGKFSLYELRDASRVLWAFGRLNWCGSNLFKQVLKCFEQPDFIESRQKEFFPQYVAHLAWATGKIGQQEPCINMLDQLGQVYHPNQSNIYHIFIVQNGSIISYA